MGSQIPRGSRAIPLVGRRDDDFGGVIRFPAGRGTVGHRRRANGNLEREVQRRDAISYDIPAMVDIAEARRQCELFIAEMSANRPNCDDAGVARKILSDLDRYGQPSPRTRARLTHWCHTNGSLYQRGVPTAKAICFAIYGRILPRED